MANQYKQLQEVSTFFEAPIPMFCRHCGTQQIEVLSMASYHESRCPECHHGSAWDIDHNTIYRMYEVSCNAMFGVSTTAIPHKYRWYMISEILKEMLLPKSLYAMEVKNNGT